MGDSVFVQPTSGPCDVVLLAVESARDAQEGWVQSRCPREMPLPPGASGTHAGEFPHLFPLILSTWGAARRGSRGHTRLPPPGAGSPAGPFGPRVLHCGRGQLLEPPEGSQIRSSVCECPCVCGCVCTCVWQGVCVCGVSVFGVWMLGLDSQSLRCAPCAVSPHKQTSSEPRVCL